MTKIKTNLFLKQCLWKRSWLVGPVKIPNLKDKLQQSRAASKVTAETMKNCSCHLVKSLVRDFKLSLTTVLPCKVYTLCLIVSWHCSLSFGLVDKDNPVKFLSRFFLCDCEGQPLRAVIKLNCNFMSW